MSALLLLSSFVSLFNSQQMEIYLCVIQGLPGKAGAKGAKGGAVSISVCLQLS